MKIQIRTRIEKTHTIRLTGADIIELLRAAGRDVPNGAEVMFDVPTGGDYSGDEVDVSDESPVRVVWHESTSEDT